MASGRSSNISKEWQALRATIFSIALRLILDTENSLSGALLMPGLAEPQSDCYPDKLSAFACRHWVAGVGFPPGCAF